ncbi:MAG TPA: hypothetical protein V6C52_09485 [Coleofasciculaceae cyanobacterium]|jgi:hypothetical protein
MKRFQVVLAVLLTVSCVLFSAMPQAEAWPFGKKAKAAKEAVKQVQTYQPPPADAQMTQCEPIRRKIVKINKGSKIGRTLMAPRTAFLTAKHTKCKQRLMDQEFEYLKHVDIEQSPSLPKLKTDTPTEQPAGGGQSAQP